MNDYAARLKYARKKRRITQAKLEELALIPRQTVSLYERGKRTPDIYTAARISEALNVSLDWMAGIIGGK